MKFTPPYPKIISIWLLLMLSFLSSASITADDSHRSEPEASLLSSVDINQLLLKHPLMSDYDKTTMRFRNTESEILPVDELKSQMSQLELKLDKLKRESEETTRNALENSSGLDETSFWSAQASRSEQISKLERERYRIEQLILSGGETPHTSIIPQVKRIINEIYSNPEFKFPIVLNRLPVIATQAPGFQKYNPYLAFFWRMEKPALEKYLEMSQYISGMFNCSKELILYQNPRLK